MENETAENRKRAPVVSLGNIIAALAFIGAIVGIYTQVIADTNANKLEIVNLKQTEKEARQELKQDIRDVKTDIKELRNDVQKILQEVKRK